MSDEKGRATMFDGWDLKPKERARQLQGKVFELEAQNAGLVRALEAGIALATDFETAKDSDDELDVIHRLTAWGDQSAIEIKRAASRSLASPPGTPAGLRPAREVAHELCLRRNPIPLCLDGVQLGGKVQEHSKACDFATAAIESDRSSRPPGAPMLDPVPRGHCGRCDRCGWPMGGEKGQCRPLDCSMRPMPAERPACAGCGAPFEPRPAPPTEGSSHGK